jgi:hypothetical protein
MLKEKINKSIENELKKLKKVSVKIGIVGKSDSKLLTIASVNEYGANILISKKMRKFLPSIGIFVKAETTHIVIPERSFIRSTLDNVFLQNKMISILQKKTIDLFNGKISVHDMLEITGLFYQSEIRKTMIDTDFTPNHPATIKLKGKGKKPLMDTGRLQTSIGYVVA